MDATIHPDTYPAKQVATFTIYAAGEHHPAFAILNIHEGQDNASHPLAAISVYIQKPATLHAIAEICIAAAAALAEEANKPRIESVVVLGPILTSPVGFTANADQTVVSQNPEPTDAEVDAIFGKDADELML